MAKFNVGDLVDVRLDDKILVGWSISSFAIENSHVVVCRPDLLEDELVHVDDCIPYVPAPVVQPASVDPLTGLTAVEMERRYSARLSAFGRGEADPFGPRLVRVESVGPAPKITFVDDCGSPNHVCDLCCGPAEGPVPRPLTIEDVKVGSRWVLKEDPAVEVAVIGVREAFVQVKGSNRAGDLSVENFLSYWKPASEAAPVPSTTWVAGHPHVVPKQRWAGPACDGGCVRECTCKRAQK